MFSLVKSVHILDQWHRTVLAFQKYKAVRLLNFKPSADHLNLARDVDDGNICSLVVRGCKVGQIMLYRVNRKPAISSHVLFYNSIAVKSSYFFTRLLLQPKPVLCLYV